MNFTGFLVIVGGTILLKIIVTWIKNKVFEPIEKARNQRLWEKNQERKQQEKDNLKRKRDETYQNPKIFTVEFDEITFSNQECNYHKKTIVDNTNRLNNYYNSNVEELLINSVDKCYEYYQETYSSVNLIRNQVGIHNINARHLMDLFCLTIIQSSLWALNSYANYPYDNLNEFKKKWEYTDMQSKVQAINNMLIFIKTYPISADILPRYNHATQFILKLKQQYNFQIR